MSKIMYQNVEYGESGVTSVNGSTGAVNIKTINGQGLVGSGNLTINTGLLNLVDGSASGSVRGIGTATEDSSYTMGSDAFSEGSSTKASGSSSHAEGYYTQASGETSHSQNTGTVAQRKSQTALGEYNIADTSGTTTTRGDYVIIVGNGADNNNRSNALTVDWSGNVYSSAANGNLSAVKIIRWTETT